MLVTFRTDWAMALRRDHGEVVAMYQSPTAPNIVPEAASSVSLAASVQTV